MQVVRSEEVHIAILERELGVVRADVKALLRLLGMSAVLALVIVGILTAAALGALGQNAAVYHGAAVFIVGAIVIGKLGGRALRDRGPTRDADT